MSRKMNSNTPLFEGQKTHPLSKEEKDVFLKKVYVKYKDVKIIYNALSDAFDNNLAVRQFVREVNLNHPNISFNIDVVKKIFNAVGLYSPSEKKIYLSAAEMSSKEKVAETLCHEMLHQIQHESLPSSMRENPILKDAETMALGYAVRHDQDPAFNDSLQKNKRRWEEIAKGQTPRPAWAPAFKCLVPGKEDEARKAYVEEMALLETKTQYIQDFIQTEQWGKDGKTHLPSPSYTNYSLQQNYRRRPFYSPKEEANTDLFIRDIMKRNPGLKRDDFKDMYTSLNGVENQEELKKKNNEYKKHQETMNKIYKKIVQLSPSDQKRLVSKLPEELRNKSLSKYENKLILSIAYVMESKELPSEIKKEHIAGVIVYLQNSQGGKPTPERKYAIKQLEKLNGYEMPVVQNTTNFSLQNRLLDSSKPYDDETLPNMPYSRGGNGMA